MEGGCFKRSTRWGESFRVRVGDASWWRQIVSIMSERVIIIKPCTPVVWVAVVPCNWAHAHVGEGKPLCFLFEEGGDDLAITA